MKLIRWNPARDINGLHNEIDRMFNGILPSDETQNSVISWMPRADIQENDDNFEIHADIPGVDKKDIKIVIDKGVLSIGGYKEIKRESDKNNFHRIERFSGEYSRSFHLPEMVETDSIKASYDNGVLSVKIPKKTEIVKKEVLIDID